MTRTITLLVCLSVCSFAARQVITLEDKNPRDLTAAMAAFVRADATIANVDNGRNLVAAAIKNTPSEALNVNSSSFAAIIHVVKWKTQSTPGLPQAESSHWYVYSGGTWNQDDFATNNRVFGIRHIVLVYVYLNLPGVFTQFPTYDIEVTSKLPANIQHLFQLAGLFIQAATNNQYGAVAFDVPYLPSDMSITPELSTPNGGGPETVNKTGDSQLFDNEGFYHFDFSVGVPIRKMSEVKFDSTNNTVAPQTVDKRTMFALMDLYPFKKDVKSTAFDWRPYGIAGVGIASQPLHRILAGVGWGPQFAQFYIGALFAQQQSLNTLQAGSMASPGQVAADTQMKYKVQFAFGINIPVARAASALAAGSQTKTSTPKAAPAAAPAKQ